MNSELLTRKIKKIGQEISSLAQDIEHNKNRKHFFIDLIKTKTFELYELCKELQNESPLDSKEENPTQFLKKSTPKELFRTELDELKKNESNPLLDLFHADETTASTPVLEPKNSPEADNIETPPIEINDTLKTHEEDVKSNIELHDTLPKEEITIQATKEEPEIKVESENKEESITLEENVREENTVVPIPSTPTTLSNAPSSFYLLDLLDDYLSKKNNSNDISNRLQNTPISNFTTAVSISQKHLFINELFGNNPESYKATLSKIETIGKLQDSLWFLEQEILPTYQWVKKEKSVVEFLSLIRRRFIA